MRQLSSLQPMSGKLPCQTASQTRHRNAPGKMRTLLIGLAGLLLSGCSILEDDAQRGYAQTPSAKTPFTYTTGGVRIVTQRTHPVLHNDIVCTEPPPDVAQALATALSSNVNSGKVGATLSGSSAEAVAELAGRSTALLGLRDGLFRACEAYANGVIGQDAYALVLSRYGHLMTTLFLGQDIAGAAGTAASTVTIGVTTAGSQNLPTTTTTMTPSAKSAPGADATPLPPAAGAARMLDAATGVDLPAQVWLSAYHDGGPAPVATPAVVLAAAAAPTTPAAPAAAPAATTPPATGTSNSTNTATAPATLAAAAPLTVGRMNEDYFNLDNYPLHLLLVACINNEDQTRLRTPLQLAGANQSEVDKPELKNTWLTKICDGLTEPKFDPTKPSVLSGILALQAKEWSQAGTIKPINPEAAAAQPANSTNNSAKSAAPPPDPTVKAVQDALLGLLPQSKCDPGTDDGVDGPQTQAAVTCYQYWYNLTKKPPSPLTAYGVTKDPATMKTLGVAAPAPKVGEAPVADGAARKIDGSA